MRNRSFRQNKFNPPSMRKLWKEMGGYDALVEYNECAVRQFIRKWENVEKAGERYSDFLKEQSAEVGIHLGNINIEEYRQDIYRWYLIHPYGCVDKFVKELKDNLKAFSLDVKIDYPDKTALERLITGLKSIGLAISVENYKIELDKYYHRFRNLLAHKLNEKEEEKVRSLFKGIQRDRIHDEYPTLTNALSAPGILSFDDYTLCTANLKNITDTLVTDVYKVIDWGRFEIEETKCVDAYKRFGQNPERFFSYIKLYISSTYGIDISEDKLNILQKKLIQANNG